MTNNITAIAKNAKAAQTELSISSLEKRNEIIKKIAKGLKYNSSLILKANKSDIDIAHNNGLSKAITERLTLNQNRIDAICEALEDIIRMQDPIGRVLGGSTRPNGLRISKVSVPLGVIGMIYESRPNVTVDAAVLCIKSANACILRGGKETLNTNIALIQIMHEALESCGVSPDAVQLIKSPDRSYVDDMMKCDKYIDVLIPRGGESLINHVIKNATVPVIATGVGNCHVFIDESADMNMALNIADNAKNSRPSVCNAAETLLVHKNIAERFLPEFKKRCDKYSTRLMLCEKSYKILEGENNIAPAEESDWETEYLDYCLSVKTVENVNEAIAHINKYSTGHSEAIVTNNYKNANLFTSTVNSAAVYVNASTRFTDGGEFGLGAEIGISTQKLHARGPMGLEALTTVKYIIEGNGQIRI